MEVQRSARKHGIGDDDIVHAVDHALVVVDVEPTLTRHECCNRAGPGRNLLEIIWLGLPDQATIVIHAMPLRRTFCDLLPTGEDDS